ncbi:MAG: GNAT family N-acetyltransferase [Candidatus Heimdallarchaeota archaeon]|nr:GNAT family N-acetyltransferase [Candidatus Heimdallarchaeota archaeon]
MKIRQMTKRDSPKVISVLAEAFNDSYFQRRNIKRERSRTQESILPYLELEPEGAFVACSGSKILGALFAHTWGKFGWIGTFGVLPENQNEGIGKKLLEKGLYYLTEKAAVTTLALETMPSSMTNIGLYSKQGFRPAFLTIKLQREIPSTFKTMNFSLNNKTNLSSLEISYFSKEENKEDILTRCSWLSDKLHNGLDYTNEILITNKYALGETILVKREGFVIGYAICRAKPKYEEEDAAKLLEIKVLVIDKSIREPEILDLLINACEEFGFQNGKQWLKLSINSSYWVVYRHLLDKGFTVVSAILRMIKFSEDIISHDRSHEWLVNCSSLTM